MSIPKPLSIIILFALSFSLWVSVFDVVGITGVPARFLFGKNCCRPGFELVGQVFENEGQKNIDYIAIGTSPFIEQVKNKIADSNRFLGVRLDVLTTEVMSKAVGIFSELNPKILLLQNAPHMWTDIATKGGQNLKAWELYKRKNVNRGWIGFSLDSLNTIKEILLNPCNKQRMETFLPERFLWASFLPEPILSERVKQFDVNALIEGKSIWVFNPDWIPEDTMQDTYTSLIAYCSGIKRVPGLGIFASIDDFDQFLDIH